MNAKVFWKVLVLTVTILCLHSALANPVKDDNVKDSFEEIDDLKVLPKDFSFEESVERTENSAGKLFDHHDEDQPRAQIDLDEEQNLKYDVEILESRDMKKESSEIEERFKGSAIQMNTDTFVAENIEVSGGDNAMQASHLVLTIILVLVAVVSIGLYAALVIWRAHLEMRYGMRELLVTHDDDFSPSNNSSNSSNTRHFIIGQS